MKTQNSSLRIVVADDERDMRDFYQRMLLRLGHQIVGVAATGPELVRHGLAARPDLIVTDARLPALGGIEAAEQVCQEGEVPVIVVSAHHDPHLVERALAGPVLAYLAKPIDLIDLELAIVLTVRRFQESQTLRREVAELRQALEDRKLVERAKGLLMTMAQLDEPSAFRRLQKLARDKNLKLAEVARMIVQTAELLQPVKNGTPANGHSLPGGVLRALFN